MSACQDAAGRPGARARESNTEVNQISIAVAVSRMPA